MPNTNTPASWPSKSFVAVNVADIATIQAGAPSWRSSTSNKHPRPSEEPTSDTLEPPRAGKRPMLTPSRTNHALRLPDGVDEALRDEASAPKKTDKMVSVKKGTVDTVDPEEAVAAGHEVEYVRVSTLNQRRYNRQVVNIVRGTTRIANNTDIQAGEELEAISRGALFSRVRYAKTRTAQVSQDDEAPAIQVPRAVTASEKAERRKVARANLDAQKQRWLEGCKALAAADKASESGSSSSPTAQSKAPASVSTEEQKKTPTPTPTPTKAADATVIWIDDSPVAAPETPERSPEPMAKPQPVRRGVVSIQSLLAPVPERSEAPAVAPIAKPSARSVAASGPTVAVLKGTTTEIDLSNIKIGQEIEIVSRRSLDKRTPVMVLKGQTTKVNPDEISEGQQIEVISLADLKDRQRLES